MVKLLVFAILLASSPATGLLEKLFHAENSCYSGCQSSYSPVTPQLEACQKGCNFKLLYPNCAPQCKSMTTDKQLQASCEVGCTLSSTVVVGPVEPEKPIVAVDPVPETKQQEIVSSAAQQERPRSIILIRLRQRPSFELPSMHHMSSMHDFFNSDPVQMFNDMLKQFQAQSNNIEQSIRKSMEENGKEMPKPIDFPTLSELPKIIPVIRIPLHENSDSSSEEDNDKKLIPVQFRHALSNPHEFHQYHHGHMRPMHNRFQQFVTDVRTEWNDLVRKQPKIPVWIFLAIFLSSSAILWYMVMSLCRHTPSRDVLSIRAQELVFHPYDYEAYEKEKIQPDDQPYEVTESLPIKVKLSNI